MSLMGNPMDLEILSGLDQMDDDMGVGGAPEYFNALAGYDPAHLAAIMGLSLNPFHYLAQAGRGFGRGVYNVTHGRRPWAKIGRGAMHAAPALALAAAAARSPFAQPTPLNALVSNVPGVTDRGTKVQPLGFTNGTFTATSGTTITVRARPQRPLRGGRLVGSFARNGVSATGLLTLVSLFVGTDGQLLSGDPISFDALSPNAFGVGVNLTPAAVGQEIVATVAVSTAPTMTDTIAFNLTLFGMSIG